MNTVLRHLERAVLQHGAELPDQQLLERFVASHDGQAFAALLRRHGPMVLCVCRRVLGDAHDAEDAFQATFLVLARKATSLRTCRSLGGWLHGVAYRTSLKARTTMARRRTRERQASVRGEEAPCTESAEGTLELLDEELSRLPEKYRLPVVLCELEGRTRREAAAQLQIPEGTLSSRLAHAKKRLAERLTRRGALLPAGGLLTLLAPAATPACVPQVLLQATVGAALEIVVGAPLAAGMVSAEVLTLTEGMMKAMLWSKLKTFGTATFLLLLGAGAVGVSYQPVAAQTERPRDAARGARSANELEELRLEIAALRKGLELTRDRVKTLEIELQTMRGPRMGPGGMQGGEAGMMSGGGSPGRGMMAGSGSSAGMAMGMTAGPPAGNSAPMAGRPGMGMPPGGMPSNDPFGTTGAPGGVPGAANPQPGTPGAGSDLADPTRKPPGASNIRNYVPGREATGFNPFSADVIADAAPATNRSADPLREAEAALKKLRANPRDEQATNDLERALKLLKGQTERKDRVPGREAK